MKKKTNKAMNTWQQGDLIGRKLKALPDGVATINGRKRLVLAHGENGHSHVIEDDEAELIQIGERMLLKLSKPATVIHDEHHPITLTPGIWEIGRVREFDWLQNMERQVID